MSVCASGRGRSGIGWYIPMPFVERDNRRLGSGVIRAFCRPTEENGQAAAPE